MITLEQLILEENKNITVNVIIYNSLAPSDPYQPYTRELDIVDEVEETFTNYDEAINFILNEALSFGNKGDTVEILLDGDQVYCDEIADNTTLELDDLTLAANLDEDIEIHDTLNPKIWENEELKPGIKEAIEKIVDKFVDNLKEDKVDLKVKDILILGSNANYNYNDLSDLDIHILADESNDCEEKHLPLIFTIFKAAFNKKYDININGINVEMYVEDADNVSYNANGVYSLKDGWLKKPVAEDIPEIDTVKIQLESDKWIEEFDKLIAANPTSDDIEKKLTELYELRQDGLKEAGEFSEGNLIFKEIRNQGYIDKLKDIRDELVGKELSLDK